MKKFEFVNNLVKIIFILNILIIIIRLFYISDYIFEFNSITYKIDLEC